MKIKANLLNKPVNFQMDDCQIEKVVELPRDQFSALVITPLTNQPFIAENKRWMFADDSAVHCLLVLGQGSGDGVLIYSAGYDYPRLAAYLPGMRDMFSRRGLRQNNNTGGNHMNTELARDLQYRITKEALAMLVIHGSAAETKDYERAIILIGSAWGLDPQNAVSHLELITREKEAARGTAEPEETRHVLPESELPMNASGMETLDNVCGLFETAIQLESRDHREALFRLASKLMETQNLLDWIEKTPEEQELPELAES